MGWWRDWRRRRRLARLSCPPAEWAAALAGQPVLAGLSAAQNARLRDLALLFLHEKAIEPVGELQLDAPARLRLAAVACLPILELGLDWYDGWSAVVVYPGSFMAQQEFTDEAGVVHHVRRPLAGEAWERGPLILSWDDVLDSDALDGFHVVLHEFAHKLDMLNGEANGLPPLHRGMSVRAWAQAFGAAYEDLCDRVDAGEDTPLDPYASDSPEEFFAVASEAFFELPAMLVAEYPQVYAQLAQFYRQEPRRRLGGL